MSKDFEMTEEQQKLFDDLTPLQQKVCINSLSGMSNIDSYYAGGGKGKNKATAEANVSRMLSDAKVKAFMDSMLQVKVQSAIMSRQEMMERLSNLSRVSMSDLIEWRVKHEYDDEGKPVEQSLWALKESAMLDADKMASISEVSAGKDGIKIKQHSPLAAMKQLADLAGYNSAIKKEITGKDGGSIKISDMTQEDLDKELKALGIDLDGL